MEAFSFFIGILNKMNINSNTPQSQLISSKGKAITSLTLGIFSIVLSWLVAPALIGKEWYRLAFVIFIVALTSGIVGLISGIRDLRFKKELARLGIMLCSIGVLISVIIYLGCLILKTH